MRVRNLGIVFLLIFFISFTFAEESVENLDDLDNYNEEETLTEYLDNYTEEELEEMVEEGAMMMGGGMPEITEELLSMFSCDFISVILEEALVEVEIPKQVPFKSELVGLYVDEGFVFSMEFKDKKFVQMNCELSEEQTYNIYIASSLIMEVSQTNEEINPIDFYNEKKKSGELKIDGVGFFRSIKMGFINFGLKVASMFV